MAFRIAFGAGSQREPTGRHGVVNTVRFG